ncbi:MAG: GNAT family N-acetyltransferase [Chloroflexi bacterium]|nr:GNAT family N-acetyltransferase [Chloroflexota bacterium]MCC6897133.1 GNAT family N-acetyltransferase [Anaerolineae bacterium]
MILLRPTEVDDLSFVVAAEQRDENSVFVMQWTYDQHRAALYGTDLAHLIIEDESDQRVGFILLAGLESPHQSIEFRRIVVTEKGRGYGQEAVQQVQRFAFTRLSAHRLWLDVKETNRRARYIYAKLGFREEGVLRECLKTGDTFESLVVMSILSHEYFQLPT